MDYTSLVNESITFKPNGTKEIDVRINITDDKSVEDNETFLVTLQSSSSSSQMHKLVVRDPNSTVISIINDDGKMFFTFK
jgi:hypothetical protein